MVPGTELNLFRSQNPGLVVVFSKSGCSIKRRESYMTDLKMFRLLSGIAACSIILSLFAGCSTHRVCYSPEPRKRDLQVPEKVRFNLDTVTFVAPTNVASGNLPDFGVIYVGPTELRAKLMEKAQSAYPTLFSEAAGSIPLQVTVTRSARVDLTGGDNCVACLTLTIYPFPINDKISYTLQAKSANAEIDQKLAVPVTFTREELGRLSCWPTGWIPVSRGKGTRTWGDSNAQKLCELQMLNSCVDALVTALEHVNPAAWSNMPAAPAVQPAPAPAPAATTP